MIFYGMNIKLSMVNGSKNNDLLNAAFRCFLKWTQRQVIDGSCSFYVTLLMDYGAVKG